MRRSYFPWGPLFFILVLVLVVGGIVYFIVADAQGFKRNCFKAGGHIESIRGTDICVDENGSVIYVDSWNDQVTRRKSE